MEVDGGVEGFRTSSKDGEEIKENVPLRPRMLAKKSCSGLNKRILKEHVHSNVESSSISPANHGRNTNEGNDKESDYHCFRRSVSRTTAITTTGCRSPRPSIPGTSIRLPSQNTSGTSGEVSQKSPRSVAKKSCSRPHANANKKCSKSATFRNAESLWCRISKNSSRSEAEEPLMHKKSGNIDAVPNKIYGLSHKSKNIKITTKRNGKSKKINEASKQVYPKPPYVRPYSSPTKEVTRAMEEMADELLQDSPRVDFLKTKMWESFPYRKHFYEKKPNIGVMFEIFPALRDWRILKRDFELFERASFEELDAKLGKELDKNFQKYQVQCRSWKEPLIQTALALMESTNDATVVRDLKLLCFAYIQTGKKARGALYKEHPKDKPAFRLATPTIDVSGEYGSNDVEITVYCERRRIVTAPNFYEAVMCVYSLYYIFSLCYEKTSQPFFESFDSLIGHNQ